MRCVLVILVLVGLACHHDDERPKDRCELAWERLIRLHRTKITSLDMVPTDQLDECRNHVFPNGFILDCALQSDSDEETERCIVQMLGSDSSQ